MKVLWKFNLFYFVQVPLEFIILNCFNVSSRTNQQHTTLLKYDPKNCFLIIMIQGITRKIYKWIVFFFFQKSVNRHFYENFIFTESVSHTRIVNTYFCGESRQLLFCFMGYLQWILRLAQKLYIFIKEFFSIFPENLKKYT